MTGPGCCSANSTSASAARIGHRVANVPTAVEANALSNTRRFIVVISQWVSSRFSTAVRLISERGRRGPRGDWQYLLTAKVAVRRTPPTSFKPVLIANALQRLGRNDRSVNHRSL